MNTLEKTKTYSSFKSVLVSERRAPTTTTIMCSKLTACMELQQLLGMGTHCVHTVRDKTVQMFIEVGLFLE